MDNLEKQLTNLPQIKLSRRADIKIKFRLYAFIIVKNCRQFLSHFVLANVVLRRTVAIAMIVIMIIGGTSLYAYADDSITAGNIFYPLKRAVESVEKQVAFSQPAKIRTHEKLAERRLQEAALLSQEETTAEPGRDTEQLHERIKRSLDEAIAETGSAAEQTKAAGDNKIEPEASARAQAKEARQSQYLDQMTANADVRQDEELAKKIKETKEAMRQYREALKDGRRENKPDEEDRQDIKRENQNKNSAVEAVSEVKGAKIEPPQSNEPKEEPTKGRRPEQPEAVDND